MKHTKTEEKENCEKMKNKRIQFWVVKKLSKEIYLQSKKKIKKATIKKAASKLEKSIWTISSDYFTYKSKILKIVSEIQKGNKNLYNLISNDLKNNKKLF